MNNGGMNTNMNLRYSPYNQHYFVLPHSQQQIVPLPYYNQYPPCFIQPQPLIYPPIVQNTQYTPQVIYSSQENSSQIINQPQTPSISSNHTILNYQNEGFFSDRQLSSEQRIETYGKPLSLQLSDDCLSNNKQQTSKNYNSESEKLIIFDKLPALANKNINFQKNENSINEVEKSQQFSIKFPRKEVTKIDENWNMLKQDQINSSKRNLNQPLKIDLVLQAGYRSLNKSQNNLKIDVIQTMSKREIIPVQYIQKQKLVAKCGNQIVSNHSSPKIIENSLQNESSNNEEIIPLNNINLNAKNFKIEEKQNMRQMKWQNEYMLNPQQILIAPPQILINEGVAKRLNSVDTVETVQDTYNVQFFHQIEKYRRDMKKGFTTEKELGNQLIQKLLQYLEIIPCKDFQDKSINNNSGDIQFQVKINQIGCTQDIHIKNHANLRNELGKEIDHKDNKSDKSRDTESNQPDFSSQRITKISQNECEEDQNNNCKQIDIKRLQKTLQSNDDFIFHLQQKKEPSCSNQKVQRMQSLSNPLNANRIIIEENNSIQFNQSSSLDDRVIQSIVLCENLMESTKVHNIMFDIINKEEKSQNSHNKINSHNKFLITQNFGQISLNLLHSYKLEDQNHSSILSQQLQIHCENKNVSNNLQTKNSQNNISAEEFKIQQINPNELQFYQFTVKDLTCLDKFDFSKVRQVTQKYRAARKRTPSTII